MNISVLITYSKFDESRLYGLYVTLEGCRRQTFRDFELILAEHTRTGEKTELPFKIDKHMVLKYDGIFSKAWASNCAVKESKYGFILSLDADTIMGND